MTRSAESRLNMSIAQTESWRRRRAKARKAAADTPTVPEVVVPAQKTRVEIVLLNRAHLTATLVLTSTKAPLKFAEELIAASLA